METIYKYSFIVNDNLVIEMPKDAEIITVQTQNEIPCMWAIVNPENSIEKRVFEIYGTGHKIRIESFERKYIGTFQLSNGALVFHVFEHIMPF